MQLKLSPADKKLMTEVSDPDVLVDLVPAMGPRLQGVRDKAHIYQDLSPRGRMTGAVGFDPGFGIQHVAYIPVAVATALLTVDPEILRDKKKFYEYLNGPGKAFDLRGGKSGPQAPLPSLRKAPLVGPATRPARRTSR